ncbi:MAG: hypothetical protein L6R36_000180 [Xanthoria steineri]|nr:MAG: hypothetical protein L6R36_000180 [Xanthoria steineri]
MDTENGTSSDRYGQGESAQQTIYKPTVQVYNQWAATYDTDGNFLQKLDTMMLDEIMPYLFDILPHAPKLIELGCGTGRNTVRLQSVRGASIWALDNSHGMLQIAKDRCRSMRESLPDPKKAESQEFALRDILTFHATESTWDPMKNADAIISSLVLEHIPLDQFFSVCSKLLRPGGHLLCTNMHSDMGAISQAGFVDPVTGDKVRPLSYAHTVQEFMTCASKWDFTLVWGPVERKVETADLVELGDRGRKWVGINAWFGVIVKKLG